MTKDNDDAFRQIKSGARTAARLVRHLHPLYQLLRMLKTVPLPHRDLPVGARDCGVWEGRLSPVGGVVRHFHVGLLDDAVADF
jgi:hypothetical protein